MATVSLGALTINGRTFQVVVGRDGKEFLWRVTEQGGNHLDFSPDARYSTSKMAFTGATDFILSLV